MIRIDQDPAAAGTVDPTANGTSPDIAGFFTSGPICTILGPDWANHTQEEIARLILDYDVPLDLSDKGQMNAILTNVTGCYGNGSDGDVTVAPAGTLSLTAADGHYENLTLGANATVITNGHRLFVRGTLTMAEGSRIHNDAVDGNDYTGGAAGALGGAGGGGSADLGSGGAGGQGGDQVAPVQAQQAGATGTPDGPGVGTDGEGFGGNGGAGGAGNPGINQPGGAGGTIVPHQVILNPMFLPVAVAGYVHTQLGFTMFSGAAGGGGGGSGDSAAQPNGFGGGAGGGGGFVVVAARVLISPTAPDTTAYISARGGDGGADTTFGSAHGGGGGGGGGGTVFLVTRVRLGDPGLLTLSVGGGLGGGADPSATQGAAGVIGSTFELFA